jgi:hypothetical protein
MFYQFAARLQDSRRELNEWPGAARPNDETKGLGFSFSPSHVDSVNHVSLRAVSGFGSLVSYGCTAHA